MLFDEAKREVDDAQAKKRPATTVMCKDGTLYYDVDVNMWCDGATGEWLGEPPRGQYAKPGVDYAAIKAGTLKPWPYKGTGGVFGGPWPYSNAPGAQTTAKRMVSGPTCCRCNTRNEYAEVEEGQKYTCFSCR